MIYLDNSATSFPKPEPVYVAMDRFAREEMANPGRSLHRMAIRCERLLDDTRLALNEMFQGAGVERWILTMNGTDALNIAIKGVLKQGDHVVTSDLEHNSVSRPLNALERAGMIRLTRVASDSGYLRPEKIAAALTGQTALVVLTHASNVLGTVQPIEEIAHLTRARGALFLVDAAQSAGLVPIDLKRTPIDLLAFPGHKALYGPTGTGALYVGPRAFPRAWREGGTGGDSARETQPSELPYRLEGGTPNVLGLAGLLEGIRWVRQRGQEVNRRHEIDLLEPVVSWVTRAEGWSIAGDWDPSRHIGALSLIVPRGLTASELAACLDTSFGIAVRPGLHCAPYIHRRLGTFPDGTLRISPGPFNTPEDVELLLRALSEISAEAF